MTCGGTGATDSAMAPGRTAGRLAILMATVLFSTGGAAIKFSTLSSWQVAGWRSALAAGFLVLTLPPARSIGSWRSWLVGCAYAATLVLYVAANKTTTAANTILLQSTAPLYLLALAPLLLREPIRRRHLVLMTVLAAGLAVFFIGYEPPRETAPDPRLGNLFGAACGLTWALVLAGLRWLSVRPAGQRDSAITAVMAGNAVTVAICLPWMISPAPTVATISATDAIVLGYLGVFQVGLAYLFLTRGMRRVPALEVSLLLLLDPVLSPTWAWLLHGERPSPWALLGGALILAAVLANAIASRGSTRESAQRG